MWNNARQQTIYQTIRSTFVALALLWGSVPGTGLAATLTSIAVTPANPVINVSQTKQFTATGTFSDGTIRALIGGGDGTWSSRTSMSTARAVHAVGVVNGILYAVGGSGSSGNLATVEAYYPATNTWSTKASMPTARNGVAVGVVNGILYAVGGSGSSGPLATVEAYDPATNTWSTKASMPTARRGHAVGVVNGTLYVVGGSNNSGSGLNFLATVEAYDPTTDTWSTKTSMPTPRHGLAVGMVNGTLYAVGGGSNGSSALATVEAYDPITNIWTAKPSMSTARYGLAVVCLRQQCD